jgi:serine/threonine-protein kinase
MPMASPSSIDREQFITYLQQSGLVTPNELAGIRYRHAEVQRARSLARALVVEGVLTRFQAERLLMGRTAGFLLGPYRILEQLGRGGMGRVYKAEHLTMGRYVALKVLAPELLKTERAVQLFLHEIRAVGQLVHPHIVTAYDANQAGERFYLVLEFIDGPNLDQLVLRQGPLKVGLACDYIVQACAGLQCAHKRGMVHRDIKPANILVQRHGADGAPGMVKVSDFGLARLASTDLGGSASMNAGTSGTILTRENTVMGTPDYLSPEQARCLHKTDIRGDIYSLGCTLYFLLCGRVPFPGGTALDKLIRHSTEKPAPVTQFRSDVPPELLAILSRMMEKIPEKRFRTPEEVGEVLRPFAVSGPTPWAAPAVVMMGESDGSLPVASQLLPASDPDVPQAVDEANEDLEALSRTMSGDWMETPAPESPSRLYRRREAEAANRLTIAVVTAISIVAGLVALVILAAMLLPSGR